MTKVTLEVGDLFSVLGAYGIERHLQRVAGVGRVSVNPVSGSTTVMFDPGKTSLAAIQAAIEDCGFHCAGEALPRHICQKPMTPNSGPKALTSEAEPVPSHTHKGHAGMASSGMNPVDAMVGPKAHGGGTSDAMAHEMGHGAGMDMQVMVRDMRNRFIRPAARPCPVRSGERRHPLPGLALHRGGVPRAPQRCREYGSAGRPQCGHWLVKKHRSGTPTQMTPTR
jgi:Cu2+-exporting ATPase